MTKINRNDLCPCGSGKKYKKCCELKEVEKKKKRALGLKGMSLKLKNPGSPMVSLANKVFSVLSTSMDQPVKKSLSQHVVTSKQSGEGHCHGDSCGCHVTEEEILRHEEEERAKKRGYRTLEELIGVEDEENQK